MSDQYVACTGVNAREAHALVRDLSKRRMKVYWVDFLSSVALGYIAFWNVPVDAPISVGGLCCFVVATCLLYRASVFIHEISHMNGSEETIFKFVWNCTCGIPLLIPSFLYESHFKHHSSRSYGSSDDGEYGPYARKPRFEAAVLVLKSILAGPALAARFLLLGPIGWAVPRVRRWALSKASALVIDGDHRQRKLPARIPPHWIAQEAACFAWCASLTTLAVWHSVPVSRILAFYCVFTCAAIMNAVRVLVAHRYCGTGEPMSFAAQVIDSYNFPGRLAEIWAPVGLRYHAVHHLFPGLPYHALPEAYRRLMKHLPPESTFRLTVCPSLRVGLAELFGSPLRSGKNL